MKNSLLSSQLEATTKNLWDANTAIKNKNSTIKDLFYKNEIQQKNTVLVASNLAHERNEHIIDNAKGDFK